MIRLSKIFIRFLNLDSLRNFLFIGSYEEVIMEQFDVLVVGSGGAGMRAALEVGRRKGLKCSTYY